MRNPARLSRAVPFSVSIGVLASTLTLWALINYAYSEPSRVLWRCQRRNAACSVTGPGVCDAVVMLVAIPVLPNVFLLSFPLATSLFIKQKNAEARCNSLFRLFYSVGSAYFFMFQNKKKKIFCFVFLMQHFREFGILWRRFMWLSSFKTSTAVGKSSAVCQSSFSAWEHSLGETCAKKKGTGMRILKSKNPPTGILRELIFNSVKRPKQCFFFFFFFF